MDENYDEIEQSLNAADAAAQAQRQEQEYRYGNSLAGKQNQAEYDYLQAQRDLAREQNRIANDRLDLNAPMQEAAVSLNEQRKLNNQLASALVNVTSETGNAVNNKMANVTANNQQAISDFQSTFKDKMAQRDAKYQKVLELKEFACDEAKRKYELAAQARSQAMANVGNICKILGGIAGVVLPPPFNIFAAGGTAILGGAIGSNI